MTARSRTAKKFEQRIVPTCLGRIRLRIIGQGQPMFFWSSVLMDGSMWISQAAHFKDHYCVVLIDPPGHGGSDNLERRFTLEECALCLTQIMDAVRIRAGYIVGAGWGGMVAATFTALYPERAAGAITLNCSASAASLKQRLIYSAAAYAVRIARGLRGPLMTQALKHLLGQGTVVQYPKIVETARLGLARVDAGSAFWTLRSMLAERRDQRQLLEAVRRPVLVVAGDQDSIFSVDEARDMACAIPASEFRVLRNSGHLAPLEQADKINASIAEFIRNMAVKRQRGKLRVVGGQKKQTG